MGEPEALSSDYMDIAQLRFSFAQLDDTEKVEKEDIKGKLMAHIKTHGAAPPPQ